MPVEFGTGFLSPETDGKKGPDDDVSVQRPEIGDHDAREMAAKAAFLLVSYLLRVSQDWVVGTTGIEPVTPTMSTQCVGGNYSRIPNNRRPNVRNCSRSDHGNLGHFLGALRRAKK